MVNLDNPERVLLKDPMPVPSDVLLLAIVGVFVVEDQQTPLAVTVPPPAEVIFPPQVADVVETDVTVLVDTVAKLMLVVVKEISLP